MKNILLVCLLLLSHWVIAQKIEIKESKLYTPDTLKMDLDTLYASLKATHPDLDAYRPMKEIHQDFQAIKHQITEPMTQRDFFALVNPWYASLGDAHMNMKIAEKRFEYLRNGGYITKFKIKIIDGEIYFKEHKKYELKKGAKLISFNDIPASEIYNKLIQQTQRDGFIKTTQNRFLEYKFNPYLAIFYEVKAQNKVVISDYNTNENRTLEIAAEQVPPPPKKPEKKSKKTPCELEIDQSTNTATITIKSFGRGSYGNFRKFLKKSFKTIEQQNIQNIILDFRGNSGGSANRGRDLLAYFAKKDFALFPKNIIRASPMLKSTVDSYFLKILFKLNPKNQFSGMKSVYFSEVGTRDTITFNLDEPIKKSYHFDGNTYILLNGASASTTALVSNYFRQEKLATIIGEMPGGTANGTFGQAMFFTMPYTKIQARFACIRFLSSLDTRYEDLGIVPDYEVVTTLDEWMKDIDAPMEKAKTLI